MWENAIDGVTDAAILVLSEELREIVREKRGNVVASVETGSLLGNHLGHQTVCFVNYPHTYLLHGAESFLRS